MEQRFFKRQSRLACLWGIGILVLAQSSCKRESEAAVNVVGGFRAREGIEKSLYWKSIVYSTVLIEGSTPSPRKGFVDLEYGSGSLINERVIITAAHVLKNPAEVHVILSPKAGMTRDEIGAQVRQTARVVFHPDYRSGMTDGSPFDVGLIFLKEPVTAPNAPIKIVPENWTPPAFMHGAYLVGYGPTSLNTDPASDSFSLDAQGIYVDQNNYGPQPNRDLLLRTRPGTGITFGDSGGPFVFREEPKFDDAKTPLLLAVSSMTYINNPGRSSQELAGVARSIDLRRPEIRRWIECETGLDLRTQKQVREPGRNCD